MGPYKDTKKDLHGARSAFPSATGLTTCRDMTPSDAAIHQWILSPTSIVPNTVQGGHHGAPLHSSFFEHEVHPKAEEPCILDFSMGQVLHYLVTCCHLCRIDSDSRWIDTTGGLDCVHSNSTSRIPAHRNLTGFGRSVPTLAVNEV